MADMSGAALPGWLADRLDTTDDPAEVRKIGVDVATKLCADLIERVLPGCTSTRSTGPRRSLEICGNLNLASR